MKDLFSEYVLALAEMIAGIGIILIFAKYAPMIMAMMK